MSKEKFLQTRMDADLLARFYAAAASEDLKASHVVRRLVRHYVENRELELMRQAQAGYMAQSDRQQDAPARQ